MRAPRAGRGCTGLGKGKSAIRNEVAFYQVGTRFAQKVSLCYKPATNRVKCMFQTREITEPGTENPWLYCYGTAKATKTWSGYVGVTMNRGWIDDCHMTDDLGASFL